MSSVNFYQKKTIIFLTIYIKVLKRCISFCIKCPLRKTTAYYYFEPLNKSFHKTGTNYKLLISYILQDTIYGYSILKLSSIWHILCMTFIVYQIWLTYSKSFLDFVYCKSSCMTFGKVATFNLNNQVLWYWTRIYNHESELISYPEGLCLKSNNDTKMMIV